MGDQRLTRWSFDAKRKRCESFVYYGMKGNQNNFLSKEECEKKCPIFENPCSNGEPPMEDGVPKRCKPDSPCGSKYYCHIGADESQAYCCPVMGGDPCGQPMSRGRGNAQLPRWYWDQNRQCCQQFSYCGQKGTQNNFLTRQDCERTCY
ncbi:Protein Y43F8B.3 a, partial [Aphelenchoides avenae]